MKCYAPIRAYQTPTGIYFNELRRNGDVLRQLDIPCQQCIGCRERRASDWEIRIMHEAKRWEQKCFVTLTYGPNALPPNGSLWYPDLQKFMKRTNYHAGGGLRYYSIGEYGPINNRPHYHACLFGIDFTDRKLTGKSESGAAVYDSPTLRELWHNQGNVSVQDLNEKTASYCARYIMTKKLGKDSTYYGIKPDGTPVQLQPPRALMSKGIGAHFIQQYQRDIYPHDQVITRGAKRKPPKYYDRYLEKHDPDAFDAVKASRELKATQHREDQTPARLTVQEQVHVARIRNKQRHDL